MSIKTIPQQIDCAKKDTMSFSVALMKINKGIRVRRSGWDKGSYLFLPYLAKFIMEFDATTARSKQWVPTNEDIMASDWTYEYQYETAV